MNTKITTGVLLFLVTGAAAFGADNGIYIGAGVTQTDFETEDLGGGFRLDDDDNGFKVIAGVRPLDWLAVEANYLDFGNIEFDRTAVSADFELKGFDAFVVGLIGVPFLDVYAKVGVVRWDADASLQTAALQLRDSESGTDLTYGGGIQARFGSLGARLEYEQFEIENTDKVATITLGVTWTFL